MDKDNKIAYYKSDGTLGYKDKTEINSTHKSETVKSYCINCGAELPNGAKFCSNCAEPTHNPKTYERASMPESEENHLIIVATLISGFIFSFVSWLFLMMINAENKWLLPLILFFVGSVVGFLISVAFVSSKTGEKRVKINSQFKSDKTSICPMCGSHSVSIYRKGYNWNEAFWGRMFNIKGSHYVAGMNSNDTMCHCEHCGHRWNSHYDYRIEKQHKR